METRKLSLAFVWNSRDFKYISGEIQQLRWTCVNRSALDTSHCRLPKLGESGFANKFHNREKVKRKELESLIDPQLVFPSQGEFSHCAAHFLGHTTL